MKANLSAGRFREDLVYRLRVLEIPLPALAERKEDLPVLTASLLAKLAPGRNLQLAPETIALLAQHNWPGNVRELRNALEHATDVCTGPVVLPQLLPRELRTTVDGSTETAALEQALATWLASRLRAGASYDELSDTLEGTVLRHLLRHFNDKPSVPARELRINRATLLKRRRHLRLEALDAFNALKTEKVIAFNIQRKTLGHLRICQSGCLFDKIVIVTGMKLKGIAFQRQANSRNDHH